MSGMPTAPSAEPTSGTASKKSKLSSITVALGAASALLFLISVIVQLALGPHQILAGPTVFGLTDYGAFLFQNGIPLYVAGIMDMLNQSFLTALGEIAGFLAIVLGIIALIRGAIKKTPTGGALAAIILGSIVFDIMIGATLVVSL